MSIPYYELFLGHFMTPMLTEALELANPHLVQMFINDGGDDYLQIIDQGDERFLGKFLGATLPACDLDQTGEHIDSLCHRLISGHDLQPLLLLSACRDSITSWIGS